MDIRLSKLREVLKDRQAWCAAVQGSQRVRQDLATEQQRQSRCHPYSLTYGLERDFVDAHENGRCLFYVNTVRQGHVSNDHLRHWGQGNLRSHRSSGMYWQWDPARHLTCLSLSFLKYKMGIMRPTCQPYCEY